MTSQVKLTGPTGKTMLARALLDTGAALSLIFSKAMKTLELPKKGSSVFLNGVESPDSTPARPLVDVLVSSVCRKGWSKQVEVAATPRVTPDLPLQGASSLRDLPHIQGLILADPDFDKPGRIDLLLGEDSLTDVLLPAESKGPPGIAKAMNTVFGWAIRGPFTPDGHECSRSAPVYVATCTAKEVTQEVLTKFWELEEPTQQEPILTPEEKEVQAHYEFLQFTGKKIHCNSTQKAG